MSELYLSNDRVKLYRGDVLDGLRHLDDESVQTVVTSPPYWGLRDYGVDGQLGLEPTPEEYVERLVGIFRKVRRVLKSDGTLWLNLGDCYTDSACGRQGKDGVRADRGLHVPDVRRRNGKRITESCLDGAGTNQGHALRADEAGRYTPDLKPKDLVGIPWRVAFALQADGWYLRQDIIWHKPNPMPESVRDRCTKAHEYIFLLSQSARYYFDADAIREPDNGTDHPRNETPVIERGQPGVSPRRGLRTVSGRNGNGRNKRSVWSIASHPYPGAHFATFPAKLVKPCVKAGAREGDIVLDPFAGSGTTLQVALENGCRAVGIEINPDYCALIAERLAQGVFAFNTD